MDVNLTKKIYNLQVLDKLINQFSDIDMEHTPNEYIYELVNEFSHFNFIVCNIGAVPLFRVRRIEEFEEHLYISDLWSPPIEKVTKPGRLNDVNESLLYLSFDPITAIKESKISSDDKFSLAIFFLKSNDEQYDKEKQNSSVYLRDARCFNELEENERVYIQKINNFLHKEFTRVVEDGNEYLYKASWAIGKLIFEKINKDSIIYKSCVNDSGFNIAFKNDSASKRLKFNHAIQFELIGYNQYDDPILKCIKMMENDVDNPLLLSDRLCDFVGKVGPINIDTFFKNSNPYNGILKTLMNF